jgi:hypothetical protein
VLRVVRGEYRDAEVGEQLDAARWDAGCDGGHDFLNGWECNEEEDEAREIEESGNGEGAVRGVSRQKGWEDDANEGLPSPWERLDRFRKPAFSRGVSWR